MYGQIGFFGRKISSDLEDEMGQETPMSLQEDREATPGQHSSEIEEDSLGS